MRKIFRTILAQFLAIKMVNFAGGTPINNYYYTDADYDIYTDASGVNYEIPN